MSKGYFSYIRVSTVRQGQSGTSLTEQRQAIQRHADRWSLRIVQEFEEKETAAKSGRPVFRQMLNALRRGKADGVIIHKIDRSARNLHDWAELGELIDKGVDVQFANENLDLESRGGRLSADIQAVVAADYIRNLREEVKKGFYGRLKQGFYPMPAPVGYINKGSARPKEPNPTQALLVKEAFELYASGRYGLNDLVDIMYFRGLRNRNAGTVTRNGMAQLLHNPFYMGVVRVRRTNELFMGQHQPIVSKALFDQVQRRFRQRHVKRPLKHDFLFRRLLFCFSCKLRLIGEKQKGSIYYRCHNTACAEKTIRQESVDAALEPLLKTLSLTGGEMEYLKEELHARQVEFGDREETQKQTLLLQIEQLRNRLLKLTDAYVDGMVDAETYIAKKNRLLGEEQSLNERLANLKSDVDDIFETLKQILELANDAYLSYEMADTEQKAEMVKSLTSNLSVKDKKVLVKLKYPFQIIIEREHARYGRPQRATARTLSRLVSQLIAYVRSRKNKDEEQGIQKPVRITPGRLKLAFRRASSAGQEKLIA